MRRRGRKYGRCHALLRIAVSDFEFNASSSSACASPRLVYSSHNKIPDYVQFIGVHPTKACLHTATYFSIMSNIVCRYKIMQKVFYHHDSAMTVFLQEYMDYSNLHFHQGTQESKNFFIKWRLFNNFMRKVKSAFVLIPIFMANSLALMPLQLFTTFIYISFKFYFP